MPNAGRPLVSFMLSDGFLVQGPPMQEHKYPAAFPLKHQQKDMRLALELAQQRGQQLPTVSAANSLYEQV